MPNLCAKTRYSSLPFKSFKTSSISNPVFPSFSRQRASNPAASLANPNISSTSQPFDIFATISSTRAISCAYVVFSAFAPIIASFCRQPPLTSEPLQPASAPIFIHHHTFLQAICTRSLVTRLLVALSRTAGSIRALVALFRYRSIRALVALFRYRSIRALGRPISPCGLNTGSVSPYLALRAQYGLCVALSRPAGSIRALVALFRYRSIRAFVALFRYRSIRALGRPISLSLNTGSCHPGVALRLPWAVFWRPFRALISPRPTCHICRRQMSIPPRQINNARSRGRQFPLAIYGEGVADRPGARSWI